MGFAQHSMDPSMQAQDELIALFSQNLHFNQGVMQNMKSDVSESLPQAPMTYSISRHYHHSTHSSPFSNQQESQRSSSEPPQSDSAALEMILRTHGLVPATLTPSQIQLFRAADAPQKRRLLELWSICPPNRAADIPGLAWSSTSMEHEESLVRIRQERQERQEHMQTENDLWQSQGPEPEPYMTSGYEELMRRERESQTTQAQPTNVYRHFGDAVGGTTYHSATDPAYIGPDYARERQQLQLAAQYGALDLVRNGSSVDAMDVM